MDIEVRDLCFRYRNGKEVLNGIDLHISEPGLYCILGPNGVGKSTLAKCIDKLLTPTSGTIRIDGKDIGEYTAKSISRVVGYIPVSVSSVFSMTVMDSVLMGVQGKRRWRNTDGDIETVHRALKVFGLEGLAMRSTNELSAGQNQCVSLARGLVQDTPIIIMDEPTANLDVRHQVFVTELFHELAVRTGKIVLMISHDLNITSKYADKVILMAEPGRIHSIGTPGETLTRENLACVYGVDSTIFSDRGRPLISLGDPLRDGVLPSSDEGPVEQGD